MLARGGRRLALALAMAATSVIAACTGIAGISGYEVDPCFDGCDAAPETGADAPVDTGSETSAPPDGGSDASIDAPPCACPAGTTEIGGVCAVTRPLPNSDCNSAIQVPSGCKITLVVNICDGDQTFDYEPPCQGDAGIASRPSAFFQLGKSPTGKTKGVFKGPYVVARPNLLCNSGAQTCAGGGTATSNFTNVGMPDDDRVVVGKRSDPGCQDTTLTFEPAPP